MPYRFKSVSGFDLYHNRSGINFTSGLYIDVDGIDIILTSTCPQVSGWINSGQMVFNDGSRDFEKVEAIEHLKWSGSAKELWFNNATNGFAAKRVQEAIEEAKATAAGLPRLTLILTNNGTVSNGQWITYSELLSNKRILFPVKTRIKEISWVNANTNLGAFNFEFYKNGQEVGNKVLTYVAPSGDRTLGYGYYVLTSNLDFNAGDSLFVKNVRPSGTALADLALTLWVERIS